MGCQALELMQGAGAALRRSFLLQATCWAIAQAREGPMQKLQLTQNALITAGCSTHCTQPLQKWLHHSSVCRLRYACDGANLSSTSGTKARANNLRKQSESKTWPAMAPFQSDAYHHGGVHHYACITVRCPQMVPILQLAVQVYTGNVYS
jgi:hypothetical protein